MTLVKHVLFCAQAQQADCRESCRQEELEGFSFLGILRNVRHFEMTICFQLGARVVCGETCKT